MMTSDSKWKLAPCPFCGGEPMAHQNPRARSLWRLQCKFCDAGPSGQLSKEQAIAAWNRRAASPQPPAPGAEVVARVKPLVWEEITEARSDEDPTREPSGDYEAVTPVGTYYIEMYFGTDSYGWDVSFNGDHIADRDDPDDAKAVALTHFNQAILSALEPTPPTAEEIARRAAIAGWDACRKSLYAVCEDVDREAEEASKHEGEHAKGYARGMARAAKSIARGFCAMEAVDDDNLLSALAKPPGETGAGE